MSLLRFPLFWIECRNCGYRSHTLSDPGDGRFRLLLSKHTHEAALVDCDDDSAFTEICKLVSELVPVGTPLHKKLQTVDYVFGKICDKGPDGSSYDMTGARECSKCGSRDVEFGPTDPPEYSEDELARVTHTQWDSMTEDQRRRLVLKLTHDIC